MPKWSKATLEVVPDILQFRPDDPILKRLQICIAAKMGVRQCEIASRYHVSMKTIYNLCQTFDKLGVKGLVDKPKPGRSERLSDEEKRLSLSLKSKDTMISCRVIQERLQAKTGFGGSAKTIERFLKSSGLGSVQGRGVKKTPVSGHAKKQ